MKLLVAGSMKSTPQALAYACAVVDRAVELGHDIVVGDNPKGIDRAVIERCNELKVAHYVYCIGKPRFSLSFSFPKDQAGWISISGHNKLSWIERDRVMVTYADMGMFIWNGDSAGTKAGYGYMQSLNKECWLKTYKTWRK